MLASSEFGTDARPDFGSSPHGTLTPEPCSASTTPLPLTSIRPTPNPAYADNRRTSPLYRSITRSFFTARAIALREPTITQSSRARVMPV